jgi:hypothetical protein
VRSWILLPLPELLRLYSESAIEFTRRIFPRDDCGKFDDLVFAINLAQLREELVRYIKARNRHPVGIFERQFFRGRIEIANRVVFKVLNLVLRNPEIAADRSVYVLSKFAVVNRGDTPVEQGLQFWVD